MSEAAAAGSPDPEEGPGESSGPDLDPRLVLVGTLVFALVGAYFLGDLLGKQRAERQAQQDPLAKVEQKLAKLREETTGLAPPLLGGGALPDGERLGELSARLDALIEEGTQLGVPLDVFEVREAIGRARFEWAVRRGEYELVEQQLGRVGTDGQEPILRARLLLAQQRKPDESWLQAWVTAKSDEVAEAARVLLAWQVANTDLRRARDLLSERVRPELRKPAEARILLIEAARRLEPHRVASLLKDAGPQGAYAPKARRQALRDGLELCIEPTVPPSQVMRVIKVVGLLRGPTGSEGPEFARAALGVARLLETRLDEDQDEQGQARRRQTLGELVEALGQSGLRAGPCREGGQLLDGVLTREGLPPPARAELALALARLDVRFLRPHLRALPLEALAKADPGEAGRLLLARVRCAQGKLSPTELAKLAAQEASSEVGPAMRAGLILEALEATPPAERAAQVQRALELDATGQALLASWRLKGELPEDATAQLSQRARELARHRPFVREEAARLLDELALLYERAGDKEAAAATRARRAMDFPSK